MSLGPESKPRHLEADSIHSDLARQMKSLWSHAQASPTLFVIVSQLLCSKHTNHPGENWKREVDLDLQLEVCKSHNICTSVQALYKWGCKRREAVGSLTKVASRGSFYLPSPLPPVLQRDQSILQLKRKSEKCHALSIWELYRNFYKRKREKGKYEHIKVCWGWLTTCLLQTKQKHFKEKFIWSLPFSQNHVFFGLEGTALGKSVLSRSSPAPNV